MYRVCCPLQGGEIGGGSERRWNAGEIFAVFERWSRSPCWVGPRITKHRTPQTFLVFSGVVKEYPEIVFFRAPAILT